MISQDICPDCGYIGKLGACQGMHYPGGVQCLGRQLAEWKNKYTVVLDSNALSFNEIKRLQSALEEALHERDIWEEAAGLLYDIADASMTMDFYYDNVKRHLESRIVPTDEVLK